ARRARIWQSKKDHAARVRFLYLLDYANERATIRPAHGDTLIPLHRRVREACRCLRPEESESESGRPKRRKRFVETEVVPIPLARMPAGFAVRVEERHAGKRRQPRAPARFA